MMDISRLGAAIKRSIELVESNQRVVAFQLLDDAIPEAAGENDRQRVRTLCHHASVLAHRGDQRRLTKHYREKSLQYNPDDTMALSRLADCAQEEGEIEAAAECAKRRHQAILQSDNQLDKSHLLGMLLAGWPDAGQG
jgi:hypothetical protein